MDNFATQLAAHAVASPLPFDLRAEPGLGLDLSDSNPALGRFDPGDATAFAAFIAAEVARAGARYAAGGYAENRRLYQMSPLFRSNDAEPRTLHLGIDLWVAADTPVFAVLGGRVLSAQDNAGFGDYGPTLILEHELAGQRLYSLYGHLRRDSLHGLKVGQLLNCGAPLGWLGTPEENGGWPSHLHFQLIRDLRGLTGDYPGTCRPSEAAAWLANCPDPNLLLRIPALC